MPTNDESTVTEIYKQGQQDFEKGVPFIDGNPFRCTDERHFEWSCGWLERRNHYQALSRIELTKEDEEFNRKILEEQEKKKKEKEIIQSDKRFKKSKKGKAEAAGQTTLF